jgi:hypothetical protein
MSIQNSRESSIVNDQESSKQTSDDLGNKDDIIPLKYQNLPSSVVEEIWTKPTFIDDEKNNSENKRRQIAIDHIKANEVAREEEKQLELKKRYNELSEEDKKKFSEAQKDSIDVSHEFINGSRDLEKVSDEEEFVLEKTRDAYTDFKEKNPDDEFSLKFFSDIDKKIWDNFNYRLAFDVMHSKKEIRDQEEANKVRQSIGIPQRESNSENLVVPNSENNYENINLSLYEKLSSNHKNRIQNSFDKDDREAKERAWKMVQKRFSNLSQVDNKELASFYCSDKYKDIRTWSYSGNIEYDQAWNYAIKNNSLKHREENGWIYRGVFPNSDKKTETRGSLNIIVTPEVVQKLDKLILNGTMKANYKFGEPGLGGDAADRHDAVSIYFLEDPSEEAIQEIAKIGQAHFRGNQLLGKKESEGFYISKIGSVSDLHVKKFLSDLKVVDQNAFVVLTNYLTSIKHLPVKDGNEQSKKNERIAMSEAQYYAVKDTLDSYNIDIDYDKRDGIMINSK